MTRAATIALLASSLAITLPAPAAAQIDAATMERDMRDYFAGETSEAWVFLGVGLLTGGVAAYGFTRDSDHAVLQGAAWPLAVVGVIQIAAGIVLFARTPGQVDDLDAQLDADPTAFRTGELTRMQGVNDQFDLLAITEIALMAVGTGLATWGYFDDRPFWTGVGAGLAIQAAAMLVLDLLAATRADHYTASLQAFTP
jgi:hypothetical protein